MLAVDYEKWRFWIYVSQALMTLSGWAWALFSSRRKAVAKQFSGIKQDLADQREKCVCRIDKLEDDQIIIKKDIEKLPSFADLNDLGKKIAKLDKTMGELTGRLEGINRAVDIVNEFLIHQGGKRSG